jgi:FtsP/CotA-like multicopper oxidase with cupredoxin domain
MLAYNGSIPGPTLKVAQGSEAIIQVLNEGDLEATVHWHGLRVENRYDGTHETQVPMPVGGESTYRLRFLDPGVYWYHPHIREDYGQEMGLYGNILVVPSDPDYWPPVHREVVLTLDDILLEGGPVAPFRRSETTHVAMGRFGNVLLIGGDSNFSLTAQHGEVVRFYLTNTANTRVFNVGLQGARMKLVGGDSGRCEVEQFVDELLLAPSERAVVDVLFDKSGPVTLEHHSPDRCYRLATIDVMPGPTAPPLRQEYEVLRRNSDMTEQRKRVARYLKSSPDKTLAFTAEMDFGDSAATADTVYACPMHPEITGAKTDHCPRCGMKLMPSTGTPKTNAPSQESHHRQPDGIEWEDDMIEINRMTTRANMHWKITDRKTNAVNHDIHWRFQVGDQVKLRLVNEMESDHPMYHPFHIHGAGRFLVLKRDGVVEPNLMWKDTVLVRAGQTVDILLDITNPGRWMAHCHIAEHHESGMMFSFIVEPKLPAFDNDRLRGPSALLFTGVLLSIASGLLHPGRENPNNHVAAFAEYAANAHWTHIHLGQFAGMTVVTIGILGLLSRLYRPKRMIGTIKVGAALAVVSLGLYAVLQAVDGVALKQAADAWAAVPDADNVEKSIRFANAEAIRWLEWGIRSYQSFVLGLTFVITGTLLARAARALLPIGALMGLAGIAYIVQAGVLGSAGFSTTNGMISIIEISLVSASSAALLVVSWKRRAVHRFSGWMRWLFGSHYEHVLHLLKIAPTGV